mmetsp:Transcript_37128/g.98902  ORF Transcript_37128/g.98902 Transcript_37128/m.98902 type:complete len:224 (-) Transcript_37128:41-712(-)
MRHLVVLCLIVRLVLRAVLRLLLCRLLRPVLRLVLPLLSWQVVIPVFLKVCDWRRQVWQVLRIHLLLNVAARPLCRPRAAKLVQVEAFRSPATRLHLLTSPVLRSPGLGNVPNVLEIPCGEVGQVVTCTFGRKLWQRHRHADPHRHAVLHRVFLGLHSLWRCLPQSIDEGILVLVLDILFRRRRRWDVGLLQLPLVATPRSAAQHERFHPRPSASVDGAHVLA